MTGCRVRDRRAHPALQMFGAMPAGLYSASCAIAQVHQIPTNPVEIVTEYSGVRIVSCGSGQAESTLQTAHVIIDLLSTYRPELKEKT